LFPGMQANAAGNSINIVWTSVPPYPSLTGQLLKLNLKYKGMTNAPLAFLGTCEVTQGVNPLVVTYTNGAVNLNQGNASYPHAKLDTINAQTGGWAAVPIKFSNFGNVSAVTQKIQYDPTRLDFVNVTTAGSFAAGTTNYSASNGVVTIVWTNTNPLGLPINWSAGHKLILNFIYTGATATPIVFNPGCEITNPDLSNVQVVYQAPGLVTPGTPTSFVSFGSPIGTVQQGAAFKLPLNLTGFTGANKAAAFTLNIPYDNEKLSFLGLVSVPTGVSVNAAGSTIHIVYENVVPVDLNGEFLQLRFIYNGVGNTPVDCGPGCLFSRSDGSTIQVGYTPVIIIPAPSTVSAFIGSKVVGAYPDIVNVPVYFTGLSTTLMGAATLYIGFDLNELDYIGIANAQAGTNASLSGNQVIITWSQVAPGLNIDSTVLYPFLNLRFQIKSGAAGSKTITFKNGCQLANDGGGIVPANWNNGGVNLMFKVKGFLTYGNAASTALNNCTVNLKSGATVVGSATTNSAGYYEIYALNGSYTLQVICPKTWGGVSSIDIVRMRQHILNQSLLTGLPFKAGDVDGNGLITNIDVVRVQQRILGQTSTFPIGDWVYNAPNILLNSADQTVNFQGLCTGDVNASYIPPVTP
jgi:hypothetical protein